MNSERARLLPSPGGRSRHSTDESRLSMDDSLPVCGGPETTPTCGGTAGADLEDIIPRTPNNGGKSKPILKIPELEPPRNLQVYGTSLLFFNFHLYFFGLFCLNFVYVGNGLVCLTVNGGTRQFCLC